MELKKVLVFSVVLWTVNGIGATKPFVTLEEAYRAATSRSELVGESQERFNQADDRVDQGRGGIFPSVSFTLGHLVQPEPADVNARAFSPSNQTSAYFTASQPIFKGLREFSGLSALKYQRSASEAAQKATLTELFQSVVTTYLGILTTEKDLKNVQEQLSVYESRIEELRKRQTRGESNASEVVSAEATQASLSAESRLLEGQLAVSRENLRYLTGLEREVELKDPDVIGKQGGPQSLDKYLARIESRPDVKEALDRFESSRQMVSVAWGAHAPSVDVVGNYYLKRPGFLADLKWDLGVRLTVPIFEGGATQAKVSEAISKRKEAELALHRTRRSADQQIRAIHQRLLARLDHMTRLRKSVELTKKNTQLMQKDYRRGLTRNVDVQMALAEYSIAQRGFDRARFTSQVDMYDLQAASAMAPLIPQDSTSKENAQ